MSTRLTTARAEMLDRLAAALELELRLIHSTESDRALVAREHDIFCEVLDRLISNPQSPHIRRFTDLNSDEFASAEYDCLVRFRDELDARVRAVAVIMPVPYEPYSASNSIAELAELMTEPRRVGTPNQFSVAQQAGIRAVADPERYYGHRIASIHFPKADDSSENSVSSADASRAGQKPSESRSVDLTSSLFEMKAQVLVDAVRTYLCMNEDVLVITLLKVKQWLADPAAVPRDSTDVPGRTLIDAGIRSPGLELCAADPRTLAFSFTSLTGTRALFSIGPTNTATAALGFDVDLPELLIPNISLILVSAAGRAAGSAYVAAHNAPGTPLDRLALLIRKLDFAAEVLRLTSLEPARTAEARRINKERHSQLLHLAREM